MATREELIAYAKDRVGLSDEEAAAKVDAFLKQKGGAVVTKTETVKTPEATKVEKTVAVTPATPKTKSVAKDKPADVMTMEDEFIAGTPPQRGTERPTTYPKDFRVPADTGPAPTAFGRSMDQPTPLYNPTRQFGPPLPGAGRASAYLAPGPSPETVRPMPPAGVAKAMGRGSSGGQEVEALRETLRVKRPELSTTIDEMSEEQVRRVAAGM